MSFISQGKDALSRRILERALLGREFCVVSNNCWGTHIYKRLGREYNTPFIGVAIMPECYLNLLTRLRSALANPITFVPVSRHASVNERREKENWFYPIGRLADDIEIQFYHETDAQAAAAKWHRRVQRMPTDDRMLFVKFCDHDRPSPEQLEAFDRLPLEHKVCFTGSPQPSLNSGVWIPGSPDEHVVDGFQLSFVSPRCFDATAWLQGKSGVPRKRRIVRV